ncbi:hypothetical protein, partial [Nonomuraea terrae]|uniref:hypothetical protein n=1 Tax=Nonomuraea terrae TaxID=2530383 RepID=UPI001CB6F702
VLFGRGSQGTAFAPLATMRDVWGAVSGVGTEVPLTSLVVLAGAHLFCLACVWGGAAGLGRRALEPPMLLVLGVGAAGIGAAVLLGHPAASQLYFLEGARPYLSVAAVCGVLAAARVSWARAALAAGFGACAALAVSGPEFPGGALVRVAAPYAVLALVAGVALVWRRVCAAGLAALLAGYAVPSSAVTVVGHVLPLEEDERERLIPKGALAAGRWLRDHSAPGDVVATDLHCLHPRWVACDSRHYWVSAFTERRVLVEGWAYAESTLSRAGLFVTPYLTLPYADSARLAANDAVFRAPTAENVRHLTTKYGVKWLFTGMNPQLEKVARLRFRNATSSVYELAPAKLDPQTLAAQKPGPRTLGR